MDLLLSIVRRPEGLRARFSRRRVAWNPASIRPPDDDDVAAEGNATAAASEANHPPYEIIDAPLPQPGSLVPGQERLLASWDALAKVKEANAETLYHLLLILLETVPDDSRPEGVLPPLHLSKPQDRAARPTAAHPRAYRGTKYHPPTPTAPSPVDLRPYLCGRRSPTPELIKLTPWWTEAIENLRRSGYDETILTRLRPAVDPAKAQYVGAPEGVTWCPLPADIQCDFAAALRGLSWSGWRQFNALHFGFGLHRREDLRAAIARFVALCPAGLALQWLRLAAGRPLDRRLRFLTALIETGAYTRDPAAFDSGVLEEMDGLAPDTHYLYWMVVLLREFKRGVPVDYLTTGLQYASERYRGWRFKSPPAKAIPDLVGISLDGLNRALNRVESVIDWDELALRAWESVGSFPSLAAILNAIDWNTLLPEDALDLLVLLRDQAWECGLMPERVGRAKWRFVRVQALAIPDLIASVPPDYRRKFIDHLSDYLWEWDAAAELERFIPTAVTLANRLARPPFRKRAETVGTLSYLIERADPASLERLLSAPDTSFQRLEQTCILESSARLISYGIGALSRSAAAFAIDCFYEYPGKLCRTARLLGSLPENSRAAVVKALVEHPLMTVDFSASPLQEAVTILREHCVGGISQPAPRSLLEHLEGRRSMTEGQRERGRQEMMRRLNLSRLEVLEKLVGRRLDEGIGLPAQDAALHALQLVHAADENRRPFRKFLRALAGGDVDYILAHPLTIQWIRDHSRIDMDLWLKGIVLVRPVPGHGDVRVELERDPFEALKLGTYVGSCYAIGGYCDYSPPGIVLDVNKQVLFARDETGAVIACQIVALNENEELVCFSIYPKSATGAVQALFLDYDLLFTEAFGLKIYDGDPYEHGVINILAETWWDDGAWEPILRPTERPQ